MQQLDFCIGRSKKLILLLILLHSAVLIVFCTTELFWWVKISGTIFMIFYFTRHYKRYFLLQSSKSIIEVVVKSDETWLLSNSENVVFAGKLQKNVVITNLFLLLHFKIEDQHQLSVKTKSLSLLICQDAIKALDFKLLSKLLMIN